MSYNLIKKQKLRLYGKADFIDKWGRLFVHYHFSFKEENKGPDPTKTKLENISKALNCKSPLKWNGFYVSTKRAKIFAPELVEEQNNLLGFNVSMLAKVQMYEIKDKNDNIILGWTIYPENITIT